MKEVLREDKNYPYLMKNAVTRLAQARLTARNSGVTESPLICLGGNMWCLLPWLGTYAFLALERFLKLKCSDRLGLKGMDSSRPFYIQFTMKVSPEEFFYVLTKEAEKEFSPMELVYDSEVPVFEKYDEFLPAELVKKGFAFGILGISEMIERILSWKSFI